MLRQQLTQQEEEQQSLLYHQSSIAQDDDQMRLHNSTASSLLSEENQLRSNHEHDDDNNNVSYYQQQQYGATIDSGVLATTPSSYHGQENDDDVSAPTSSEEDEDDELFSYGSEYKDNDNIRDEHEEDKVCFLFPCCSNHKQNKNHLHHSSDSSVDSDDPDDEDDEEHQESKWKMLQPVISPIMKVYEVAKEAFILITNVDDVWDSPALDVRSNNRNDEMHIYRSTSDSFASSSTMRGRDGTGGSGQFLHDGGGMGQNHNSNSSHHHTVQGGNVGDLGQYVSFRHKVGVLFWFLVLATAYASERGTFKVMVDRMGPFRMVVGAEIVMAVHALMLAIWMFIRSVTCGRESAKGTIMLPLADIGFMAILDSIQLMLAVISGSRVAPILTAVLVHFTIPISTLMNVCLFSQREGSQDSELGASTNVSQISPQHLFGSTLILISSLLGLSPAVLTVIYPNLFSSKNVMANRTAWNTILFAISCIPAAVSQIYKERTLAAFAQPVDATLLNMLLSFFSFVFTFFVSPVVFSLQGFADTPSTPEDGSELKVESWIHQYPSKEITQDYLDALQCFTGTLSDEVQIRGYPEEAHCDFAFGFVLVYVFSIITINHAVDKICNAGAIKIMHRGISGGIIMSVVLMAYYQIFVDDEEYGLFPNFYHVSCAAVLVMGSEVYHRVSLEKPNFETEYPPVGDLYDDE